MKTDKFNAVVGNPPWGADYRDDERKYLAHRYSRSVARMIDSYIYFIDQGTHLLNKNGLLGFIVPSTMLNQVDAAPIRKVLLERGVSVLLSLGQGIFGPTPLNTSTIVVSDTRKPKDMISIQDMSTLSIMERQMKLNANDFLTLPWEQWKAFVMADPDFTFFAVNDTKPIALLSKCRQKYPQLRDSVDGEIQRGVSPDVVQMHVLTRQEQQTEKLETNILRKSLSGAQIKRYKPWKSDQYIIYATRETDLKDFPKASAYIKRSRSLNTCKEVKQGKHPWWCLHRPREPQIFASPKFIGLTTKKTIELVYDETESLYVTDAMYVFSMKSGIDAWAALAVLQSRLFLFLYRVSNQGESRVIPQVKAAKLGGLPFPNLSGSSQAPALSTLAKAMCSLEKQVSTKKSEHARMELHRRIDSTDRQIDEAVYQLYGLTAADRDLVEQTGLVTADQDEGEEQEFPVHFR